MPWTTFQFLSNVAEPVKQIVYHTILSDLPPSNKGNILLSALQYDEFRKIYLYEVEERVSQIWKTCPLEPFTGLDDVVMSRFLQAIRDKKSEDCKELLTDFPYGNSRSLIESWYDKVKDDESLYHGVFEGMKQHLSGILSEQGQEALEVLEPQIPSHKEIHQLTTHSAPPVTIIENNSVFEQQDEMMECDGSGAVETVCDADSNPNEVKTDTDYGTEEWTNSSRPRHRDKRSRNNVEKRATEITTNDFNSDVSKYSFSERLPAAETHLKRNINSLPRSSPSFELSVEQSHLPSSDVQGLAGENPYSRQNHKQQTVEAVPGDSTSHEGIHLSSEQTSGFVHNSYTTDSIVDKSHSELKATHHSINSQATHSIEPLDYREKSEIKQDLDMEDFFQEDVYNVLLLGETGVGKTTFINSCANYVKYDSMQEALDRVPEILMDTTFTAAEGGRAVQITVRATTGETGARNSTNEHTEEIGKSRTQEPLIHKIVWTAENGKRKLLRIIDTPGVNDTRGQDQDAVNFKKVLNLIQKIGDLHAICLLLKPNESIMSVGFRRSLDYFFTKLHSNALRNILFCFTNTRSTYYRPGDTYTLLEKYFKDLKEANGIEITLTLSNVFCFENDCFRYMCLLLKDNNRMDKNHKYITASWMHNVREVKKLFGRIQSLKPHVTKETTNMDSVSELLSELARPLMETIQNLATNQEQIDALMKKISNSTKKAEILKEAMNQKRVVLKQHNLRYPQMICTTRWCSDSYALDGTVVYKPKRACHYMCYCSIECTILSTGICSTCKCQKGYHERITYEIHKETVQFFDAALYQEFEVCNSMAEQEKILLFNLKKELAQLDAEIDVIKKTCFEFSAFLRYSSVKAGADPYNTYLDKLIRNEANQTKKSILHYNLEDILKQHHECMNRTVKDVRAGRQSKLTYAQIRAKIDVLCGLKNSGDLISEIADQIFSRFENSGGQRVAVRK